LYQLQKLLATLRMEEEIVASAKEQSHLMATVRASTIVELMGQEVALGTT
jgi:hypothetical protein